MRIYQISLTRKDDREHVGYEYRTSLKEAERVIRETTCHGELYVYNFPLSKKGFLTALNELGGHPDNG